MNAKERKEMPLEDGNPCPFVQPFLVLAFKGEKKGQPDYEQWHVDVNGQVGLYLALPEGANRGSHIDYTEHATGLMKQVIQEFVQYGLRIVHISVYNGSAGPSHILRNGAIFKRLFLNEIQEEKQ